MENTNSCSNCFFFKPYYIKGDDGAYYEVYAGRCTNTLTQVMQFKKSLKFHEACRRWQATEKKDQPKENITDILKRMATGIEQIATHLNTEKS